MLWVWLHAIADPISANQQHMGFGPPLEDVGQGAHEDVIAAIGLKIAIHEGDHFVLLGELEGGVMAAGEIQAYLGIWFQQVGIDAVVNDADPLAERFREGAGSSLGAGPRNSGSKPKSAPAAA